MSGPKQVRLARFDSYYGGAKMITAEVLLPPKNPEMTRCGGDMLLAVRTRMLITPPPIEPPVLKL
jgi:hypothetical protein